MMRKSSIVFFAVIALIVGYLLSDSEKIRNLVLEFYSKDLAANKKSALSFMEDLKFKDFKKAATYHSAEDQKKVNIPQLIERLFKVKPEFLDIMEYSILDANLDSTKTRARVKLKTKISLLNSGKIKTPEVILYFHKNGENWFMELESSLR